MAKNNRVSSTGLDGRLFLSETMYNQEISQPLFQHVYQSDDTGLPKKSDHVATLHCCIKPLWVAMRVLGLFPIHHTSTGMADFKKLAGAFKYTVFVFVLVGSYTSFVTLHRVSILRNTNGSFNDLIFSYMCLLYCSAYWFLPIGHCLEARKVTRYINNWSNFQVQMHKLTGVPLSLNMHRQVLICTVSIPFLSLALLIFEFAMLQVFTYWEAFYYIYINTIYNYSFIMWCYVCLALSRASSYLKFMLAEELRTHACDQGVVPKYRAMWEELSCLTKTMGDVLCYTYGSMLIFTFTVLTCSIYGSISEDNSNGVKLKQIGLGFNSLVVFACLFLVCNSAHLASEAVGSGFLSHLKQLKSQNSEVQHQLEQFQKAVSLDPPRISLGGYVTMNRELLISLMATIVTYLVVLLQFQAGEQTGKSVSQGDNVFHAP